MSVDLPEPEGPMIAVNCPAGKSMETPRSAVTVISPVPYTFTRSTARTAAGTVAGGTFAKLDVVMGASFVLEGGAAPRLGAARARRTRLVQVVTSVSGRR